MDGIAGNISHRFDAVLFQLLDISSANSPEIPQGGVMPQLLAIRHLIQTGYAHTILICCYFFGHDIHSHFCQIEIGAYTCCSCDTSAA